MQNLTAPQATALTALLNEWEAQGKEIMDTNYRLAADLGVSAASLTSLVKRGLAVSKSDSVSLWGETTRKAYRITVKGRGIAAAL